MKIFAVNFRITGELNDTRYVAAHSANQARLLFSDEYGGADDGIKVESVEFVTEATGDNLTAIQQ